MQTRSERADSDQCNRAKTFWVGYLPNMTPRKYCREYCVFRNGKDCSKTSEP